MNAPYSPSVTGLILSGGQARRMGGEDKGLLLYRQRTLIQHVLTALRPQVEHVIISANRSIDQYQQYGHPVLTDQLDDFQGPLAGIMSALTDMHDDYLLVAPCDSPALPAIYRQRMLETLLANQAELAVATDGQHWHPVFCLLSQTLTTSLERYLASGERKLANWLKQHRVVEVDFSDMPAMFINMNTAEDLLTPLPIHSPRPILGFAAFSGTGKTTLLTRLLPCLNQRGIKVAVIKHAHHNFDIDKPGKDSYQIREAGARQILIASSKMQAWIEKPPYEQEPQLAELVQRLDLQHVDLILVEGFKHETFAKIELHRPSLGTTVLYEHDPTIIAIASDEALSTGTDLPQLDLNHPEAIADFIHLFMTHWTG